MALSSIPIPIPIPTMTAFHRTSACRLPRSSFMSSGLHLASSSIFVWDGSERLLQRRMERPKRCRRVEALFGLGVPELVVIAGVAAIIFGPKQLPEIGKSLGRTVKSFQEAAKEFETEVKRGDPATSEGTTVETPGTLTAVGNEKESTQA